MVAQNLILIKVWKRSSGVMNINFIPLFNLYGITHLLETNIVFILFFFHDDEIMMS